MILLTIKNSDPAVLEAAQVSCIVSGLTVQRPLDEVRVTDPPMIVLGVKPALGFDKREKKRGRGSRKRVNRSSSRRSETINSPGSSLVPSTSRNNTGPGGDVSIGIDSIDESCGRVGNRNRRDRLKTEIEIENEISLRFAPLTSIARIQIPLTWYLGYHLIPVLSSKKAIRREGRASQLCVARQKETIRLTQGRSRGIQRERQGRSLHRSHFLVQRSGT